MVLVLVLVLVTGVLETSLVKMQIDILMPIVVLIKVGLTTQTEPD